MSSSTFISPGSAPQRPVVSLVIPAKDEAENLPRLLDEIARASRRFDYEVLVVDDGSVDGTWRLLIGARRPRSAAATAAPSRSAGQSTSLWQAASGRQRCLARDPRRRRPERSCRHSAPARAGAARRCHAGGGAPPVAPRRLAEAAVLARRQPGPLALLGDGTPDTGCGLKLIDAAPSWRCRTSITCIASCPRWCRRRAGVRIRAGRAIGHALRESRTTASTIASGSGWWTWSASCGCDAVRGLPAPLVEHGVTSAGKAGSVALPAAMADGLTDAGPHRGRRGAQAARRPPGDASSPAGGGRARQGRRMNTETSGSSSASLGRPLFRALPGAVGRQRTGPPQHRAARLLVPQPRRRRNPVRLCDVPARSGLHRRPGRGTVHLPAQPRPDPSRRHAAEARDAVNDACRHRGRPPLSRPLSLAPVSRRPAGVAARVSRCLYLALGIGLRDPWPSDEPRFALVAQEMLDTGRVLDPAPRRRARIPTSRRSTSGSPQLSIALTGFGAPRFPAAVAACRARHAGPGRRSGAPAVRRADRLDRRRRRLLASVQFVLQAKTAQIDMVLTFFTTLAAYGLLRHALAGPGPRMVAGQPGARWARASSPRESASCRSCCCQAGHGWRGGARRRG